MHFFEFKDQKDFLKFTMCKKDGRHIAKKWKKIGNLKIGHFSLHGVAEHSRKFDPGLALCKVS